jgi:DNA replication protein DnaC
MVFQNQPRNLPVWPDRHGCAQESAALQRDADQRALISAAEAAVERRWLLDSAGLSGLVERCTFQRFAVREDWPEAVCLRDRIWDYAETLVDGNLGDRPWLILHGNYGTGKSHLAAAVIRRAFDAGLRGCAFRVWTSYINRLQATMDKQRQTEDEFGHETQADILAELKRGAVVVIDDIDKQPATEWARSKLYDVLHTRYNALLPTVLTFNTNISDPAIQDYIGGAVLDRIMQHAFDIVEFAGPSYRMVMA